MGIYDREYYQDDAPAGIQMTGQWSMVAKLIALNAAVYVGDLFTSDHWLLRVMAATPESLIDPRFCWQLVTYGFAHDPNSLSHIFWNMFGLFIFGREVEGIYGSKEFLRFYMLAIVLGGVVWAARNLLAPIPGVAPSLLGASGAVVAVTLLFCIHFPKRTILLMMVLPVPAWVVGVIIIVGNLFGEFGSQQGVAFDVHLVGAIFAICYYKFRWNLGRWTPDFSGVKRRLKPGPKLKVHNPESYGELDDEADDLLEKVNRDGIESLSSRERKKLEAYSRRMRQKHR